MKTWQDRKIGTRLGVVFGAILFCVIAVSGSGLLRLGRLNSTVSASMQKRYGIIELTHQTIENSIASRQQAVSRTQDVPAFAGALGCTQKTNGSALEHNFTQF